ncbi:alpha/beta hydrolase [Pandoraea apista]|uniref:alpha/beta hydrolase n=1 Tax=Pandoraea apista TaxID=93218 RepID=UPI00065991E3|nr:alpha/beta hydrolase [Pandoraea apista]CFB61393.1 Alpha/beta hydrolase family protein [Pandoraea apista]
MAHGFSAVKGQYLDRYAEAFAGARFAVLVYGHRNFGDGEGIPRQEVDPALQKRCYRDAITYVSTRADVDGTRIGIWGSSFSGGNVLEVAAVDRRVKCVVSQLPQINRYQSALRRTRADHVTALLGRSRRTARNASSGGTPDILPATSVDPAEPRAMAGADSHAFYAGTAAFAPQWRNEVTLRSAERSRENEPAEYITRISPTPLLMIEADAGTLTATDLCLRAYEDALPPKQLAMISRGTLRSMRNTSR